LFGFPDRVGLNVAAAVPHTLQALSASRPSQLKYFALGSALQIVEQSKADPAPFPSGLCRTSQGWKAVASSEQLGKTAQNLKLKRGTCARKGSTD